MLGSGLYLQRHWHRYGSQVRGKTTQTIELGKGQQMPKMEIVRAWKDEEYRDTLTTDQRKKVPEHPSGVIEFEKPLLEDESLFGPEVGRCKVLTNKTFSKGEGCTG